MTKGEPMPLPAAVASSSAAIRKRNGREVCAERGARFQGNATDATIVAAMRSAPATARPGWIHDVVGTATIMLRVAVMAKGMIRSRRPSPMSGPCVGVDDVHVAR